MSLALAAAGRVRGTAILIIALAAASSCGTSAPAGKPAPAGSSAAPTPSAPGAAASCDTGTWRSAPVSATHPVAAPTVPVVTAVRTAAHPECGYDRLVLDVAGPVPGYDMRYVTQVSADPSGEPIALPGHSFLLVTLRPAQAHGEAGAPTIVRSMRVLGYPVLKSYAVAGDFEGVVTVALGLARTTSIRVGELPGHLYIDVRA